MAEYIKRETAVKIAKKYDLTSGFVLRRHTGIADCIVREIISIPAADVAPVVHAQWAETDLVEVDSHGETYRIPNAGLRCPWCMCAFDKKLLWRRSYCPNCGAKMDGGTT